MSNENAVQYLRRFIREALILTNEEKEILNHLSSKKDKKGKEEKMQEYVMATMVVGATIFVWCLLFWMFK